MATRPVLAERVAPAPREAIVAAAHGYLDAIVESDAYWRLGVADQVRTGIFADIEAAADRRVLAVDPERGLAALAFRFDHRGPTEANGFESRYAEPNGMVIFEIWKVAAGEIVHVESILDVFDYGRPLGWG